MRIVSTLLIIVPALVGAGTAFTGVARAQTPGGDTARPRVVRQAGAPSGTTAATANDSLFRRAERLVREGRGEAGRALVDTLLAGTRPGSPQHAQALYWRASLAGDAAEAERGYRRVIVEYPVSRWAGDALLNLAQLEMARGDQDKALLHLHRFEREHPGHESRARASFWLARLHFDKKNEPRGCAALATARVSASPDDVELRNQIEYYGQRCVGVDTVVASAPARPAASTPRAPAAAPAKTPAKTPASPSTGVSAAPPAPRPAAPVPQQRGDTASPAAAPDTARDATSEVTRGAPAPDSAATGGGRAAGNGGYTVQVAAYDTRPDAEALIEKLRARGYTARLASTARPFRVRIGRYDTRADAVAALQRLRARGIEGFVTETERP